MGNIYNRTFILHVIKIRELKKMNKDIQFPDKYARRDNGIWFLALVDGVNTSCSIDDEFIDQYIREDSVASYLDVFIDKKDMIYKMAEYKINNNLYSGDGNIAISLENDSELIEKVSID